MGKMKKPNCLRCGNDVFVKFSAPQISEGVYLVSCSKCGGVVGTTKG